MPSYEIKMEQHDYKGRKMVDLVCYVNDRRFVLRPIDESKKARALFYALLKGDAMTKTEKVD